MHCTRLAVNTDEICNVGTYYRMSGMRSLDIGNEILKEVKFVSYLKSKNKNL